MAALVLSIDSLGWLSCCARRMKNELYFFGWWRGKRRLRLRPVSHFAIYCKGGVSLVLCTPLQHRAYLQPSCVCFVFGAALKFIVDASFEHVSNYFPARSVYCSVGVFVAAGILAAVVKANEDGAHRLLREEHYHRVQFHPIIVCCIYFGLIFEADTGRSFSEGSSSTASHNSLTTPLHVVHRPLYC